jgi:hypothetical protein
MRKVGARPHTLPAWWAVAAFAAVRAAAGDDAATTTATPLTYVTAVSANVMDDPAFLESIRQAPPNILHLGHVLPLNSVFGPTADYSGFKPQLVPVEEILARRDRIRRFMDDLRAAGVGRVVCYINPAIIGGDHLKREGFWSFYDHWDKYESLGIGPNPARDPIHWMQRERQSFGAWAPEPDYPLWLYRPCVNEPAWSRYHEAVVRWVADSGYDGVFVDDCIIECHHDECQRRFAAFLERRYGARGVTRLFDRDRALGAPEPLWQRNVSATLRDAETHLFWQESMRNYLARIRRVARNHNRDFIAIANWGAISRVRGAAGRAQSGKDIEVWKPATRWVMYEEAHPSGFLGPNDVFGYLLQYNHSLSVGVRPVVHSYAMTADQVELGFAECAAGGGGAFVQPGIEHPEIRRKWREFYERNKDVFEGFSRVAPVALVLAYDELRYNNREHLRQALATAQELYAAHVQFAAIPKSHLRKSRLADCRVLILPQVMYLDDQQIDAVSQYVSRGGKLVVSGECGAYDLETAPRDPARRKTLAAASEASGGAVKRVLSMEELVPGRTFDVIAALDILDPGEFAQRVNQLAAEPTPVPTPSALAVALSELAGHDLSIAAGAPDVRTVVYQRLGPKRGTLSVHAIRYAASITGDATPLHDPAPLKLSVPAPDVWRPKSATVRSPDTSWRDAPISLRNGVIQFEIPPFRLYALVVVDLARP